MPVHIFVSYNLGTSTGCCTTMNQLRFGLVVIIKAMYFEVAHLPFFDELL